MELHDRELRVELRELLEPVERALRPGRERRADLRLERVVLREERRRSVGLAPLVEARSLRQIPRLLVLPEAEREGERRSSFAEARLGRRPLRGGRVAVGRREPRPRRRRPPRPRRHRRGARHDAARTPPDDSQGANAIVPKVMATYRELLAQVRSEIDEISTIEAQERLDSLDGSLFVDVREPDEWEEGHIPGALYTGRGRLESRIEGLVPDKARPLVVYCSVGARSAFAAKVLEDLGYENVVNLAGGFSDWKRNGFEITIPRVLSAGAALALQPPPPHSRGRRGRAAAAARRTRAPHRRGRARLAGLALPRGRRSRHARDRRRRRRRRVEPPAPDRALDRPPRRAEGRLREADARGPQPGREGRAVPGAAHLGERRPHPRRRLGRDRRRRRQLPDALPRQRRVGVERHPGRARLDLPLRGPGRRCSRRPPAGRATAACSRSRRRPSSRPAAPRAACSACSRGSSARSRRTRR